MEIEVSMPLGIVVERRLVDHPWADYSWRPVAVVPGVAEVSGWQEVMRGESWTRFLCASLPLKLHRKETEAYRVNLSAERPAVYVVLAPVEEADDPAEISASLATVSPYEAQDYLDSGEVIVEPVSMPEEVAAWVSEFVEEHHKDEPFKKRKRRDHDEEEEMFGKRLHPVERRFYKGRKLN